MNKKNRGRERKLNPRERKQCQLQRIAKRNKKYKVIKKLGKRIANLYDS